MRNTEELVHAWTATSHYSTCRARRDCSGRIRIDWPSPKSAMTTRNIFFFTVGPSIGRRVLNGDEDRERSSIRRAVLACDLHCRAVRWSPRAPGLPVPGPHLTSPAGQPAVRRRRAGGRAAPPQLWLMTLEPVANKRARPAPGLGKLLPPLSSARSPGPASASRALHGSQMHGPPPAAFGSLDQRCIVHGALPSKTLLMYSRSTWDGRSSRSL